MLKGIAVVTICLATLLSALIILQPSSQESALGALAAAEKVLEQVKPAEASTKLDDARRILTTLKLVPTLQLERDKAVASIDEAKTLLASDQAQMNAATAEIKAQITHARSNLTAFTAAERAKGVKDQILMLVWPLVIATLILYVINSKSSGDLLTRMSSIISNVKIPGGLEIAFASTAVKNTQEEVLRGYRQQVIAQYDAVAAQNQISETLDRVIKTRIVPFFGTQPKGFRCTIHVRDILFEDSLYQLIDYLPRTWAQSGKGGRGRALSVRFGMVGRYWRLEENGFNRSIPTDEKQLINDWGMTKAEAEMASRQQTLCCFLIRAKNQSPVAMLYLDAELPNAFGDDQKMAELMLIIDAGAKEFGLDSALEQVWQKVQASAPLIEIYAKKR